MKFKIYGLKPEISMHYNVTAYFDSSVRLSLIKMKQIKKVENCRG